MKKGKPVKQEGVIDGYDGPELDIEALEAIEIKKGNDLLYLERLYKYAKVVCSVREDNSAGWVAAVVQLPDGKYAAYEETFFKGKPFAATKEKAIFKASAMGCLRNLVAGPCDKKEMKKELEEVARSFDFGMDCEYGKYLLAGLKEWKEPADG